MPHRSINALIWTAVAVSFVHFLFLVLVAQKVSTIAVITAGVALAMLVPGVVRLAGATQNTRFRNLAVLLMVFLATSWLNQEDRFDLNRTSTALLGMTIINGERGAESVTDGVILIDEQGLIERVGSLETIKVPETYHRIDLPGKFVLPGLINAHGHMILPGRDRDPDEDPPPILGLPDWAVSLVGWFMETYAGEKVALWMMANNAERAIAGGVTTLRSLGDPNFYDLKLRQLIENGQRRGPRLLAAGQLLCVTGGHAHQIGQVVDGPIEGRRAVRHSLRMGVDVIKIASTGGVADSRRIGEAGELQMTPEEIRAIVDEAHRKNILVAAHVESSQGVLEALREGVDSIEHGAELDDEAIALFLNNPLSLRGYSTLHPTLSVGWIMGDLTDAIRNDPQLYIIYRNGEEIRQRMTTGYKQALEKGVHIGLGTDAGLVDHGTVWKELKHMVEVGGITAADASHVGTLATAESIGVADITGSITPGKFADLLVVDGNPLEDIEALSEPYLVMTEGIVY